MHSEFFTLQPYMYTHTHAHTHTNTQRIEQKGCETVLTFTTHDVFSYFLCFSTVFKKYTGYAPLRLIL